MTLVTSLIVEGFMKIELEQGVFKYFLKSLTGEDKLEIKLDATEEK